MTNLTPFFLTSLKQRSQLSGTLNTDESKSGIKSQLEIMTSWSKMTMEKSSNDNTEGVH
jgi:hypothetical protein